MNKTDKEILKIMFEKITPIEYLMMYIKFMMGKF